MNASGFVWNGVVGVDVGGEGGSSVTYTFRNVSRLSILTYVRLIVSVGLHLFTDIESHVCAYT